MTISLLRREVLRRLFATIVLLGACLGQTHAAFACEEMGDQRLRQLQCCPGVAGVQGVRVRSDGVDAGRACGTDHVLRSAPSLTAREGRHPDVVLLPAPQPPPLLPCAEPLVLGTPQPAAARPFAASATPARTRIYLLTRRLRI